MASCMVGIFGGLGADFLGFGAKVSNYGFLVYIFWWSPLMWSSWHGKETDKNIIVTS